VVSSDNGHSSFFISILFLPPVKQAFARIRGDVYDDLPSSCVAIETPPSPFFFCGDVAFFSQGGVRLVRLSLRRELLMPWRWSDVNSLTSDGRGLSSPYSFLMYGRV